MPADLRIKICCIQSLAEARAAAAVRPHGVDVCSGVCVDGLLDKRLLAAFCHAARNA